ncbi:MAG TPA: hypothetical protein VG917_01560 [Patescibacteria group bacterium]|nr:hypothetical protein [Patescibacteria group bacterium]
MKRCLSYLIILIAFLGILSPFMSLTEASDLSTTLVRLDRLIPNTTTGGMICGQPTSNATEGLVSITFPNGFSVNNNPANWTVTTTNLLTGASAWPGIGTATGVSGQTVTFPSGNLATGTTYCFNFSAANTLTTSTLGEKSGTLTTRTSGGAPIDSGDYGLTIVANDQINVSAAVAANPTDFDASLALTNPSGSTFPQNTTLTYTLTYGSNLSYGATIDVEADWSLGTISGSGIPTVDILDYVIGSASNGYGGATPIVDTVNRKITWHIPVFPGNTTGQTVTFQLKTNSAYTGTNTVSFSVNGRVVGPGTQTPDSTVTSDYLYEGAPTPTPTPTAGPNPTSGPGPTSTPGPTVTPNPSNPFAFNTISIDSITSSTAQISTSLNEAANIVFSYGIDPTALTKIIKPKNQSTNFTINLSDLTPSTTYYFTITATNAVGEEINSDIYVLTTATLSESPQVNINSLITSSNNNIISSGANPATGSGSLNQPPTIVMPINAPYEFRFSLQKNIPIKRIRAILKSKTVLGINTLTPPVTTNLSSENVEITEIQPGIYIGRLLGQSVPGDYELYVQIADFSGNIAEQKIANLNFVTPLHVFSAKSKKPIEGARVTLFVYNTYSRIYTLISPSVLNIQNPIYTNKDGTIGITLPQGQYKIVVEAIGYSPKEIRFEIGPGKGNYPQVYLSSVGLNIFVIIDYYASTISDFYQTTSLYLAALASSNRFFYLIATLSLLLLLITTVSALSVKTHIRPLDLPGYLFFEIEEIIFRHTHNKYIYGEVMDHTKGNHLTQALVEVFDLHGGQLIAKTKTNKTGDFFIKKPLSGSSFKIVVSKNGYANEILKDYSLTYPSHKLQFTLTRKNEADSQSLISTLLAGMENLVGFSFELLLVACILFETIFIKTVGLITTLPFIIATILTIIVWLFYAHRVLRKRLSSSY